MSGPEVLKRLRRRRAAAYLDERARGVVAPRVPHANRLGLRAALEVGHEEGPGDARRRVGLAPQLGRGAPLDAVYIKLADHLAHGHRGVDHHRLHRGIAEDRLAVLVVLGARENLLGVLWLNRQQDPHLGTPSLATQL
jgi:hypothetical protein